MREGLAILDHNAIIRYLNPAAERIFGLSNGQILGKPFWSDDTQLDQETLGNAFHTAYSTGQTIELEAFFPPARTWLDLSFRKHEKEIFVYILQRSFRRSADQIVAEHLERFELISQTTTDVIWDWNLLDQRLWRSEGSVDYIEAEQLNSPDSSEAWFLAITENDRERVRAELNLLLEGNESRGVLEYDMLKRDGSIAHLLERVLILRDHRGRPVRAIGCIRDISEQKQLESQLRRAQRLESIGRVAGGIAHDLNNILTPISMALDLLSLDVNDSHERKVMESLQESISHGASLLKILLMFGRSAETEKSVLDPKLVCRDVLQIAKETFPTSIRLKETYQPNLSNILGNSTQLRQVLLNLVMNARDAMDGKGVLEIAVEEDAMDAPNTEILGLQPGRFVIISVADNGSGIPPQILDKIWDPFFTTKPEGKGTGLGLSTASAIVNAHGGGIQVSSSSQGTTFKVYIPASDQPAAPLPPKAKVIRKKQSSQSKSILYADHDETTRRVASRILEKRGFEVYQAQPGIEAAYSAVSNPENVDLIIIDIMLPDADGEKNVLSLCQCFPGVPVIATGTSGPRQSLPDSIHQLIKGYILKPFTGVELISTVEKALGLEEN